MSILTTINSNPQAFGKKIIEFNNSRKLIFHTKSDIIISGKKLRNLRDLYCDTPSKLLIAAVQPYISEKIKSISKMDLKSTFHILFLVKTLDNKYVIRLNPLKGNSDFSLFLDSNIFEILRENKLPSVSSVTDISRKYAAFDFMLMDYVSGKSMAHKSSGVSYKRLGKVFKAVHSIKGKKAGLIDMRELINNKKLQGLSDSWKDFFYINFSLHLKKAVGLGVLNKSDIPWIKSMCRHFLPDKKNWSLSLLHNDPSSRNIFTNGTQITGILDWEDAIIGDPLWEIAFIHTFLFRKNDKLKFENFCIGYGILPKIIFSNPLYWIYYLRIAILKTISKNREGYYNNNGFLIDKKRVGISLTHLKKFRIKRE